MEFTTKELDIILRLARNLSTKASDSEENTTISFVPACNGGGFCEPEPERILFLCGKLGMSIPTSDLKSSETALDVLNKVKVSDAPYLEGMLKWAIIFERQTN